MLGLSPSSFYYQPKAGSIKNQKEETDLRSRIEEIACEFTGYGYRRITKQLRREGRMINYKKVLRIMREDSLLCVIKKKWIATTDSNHPYPRFSNLMKGYHARGLNQAWVSDITYIRILTTFVYLAVILDAFSRKVIGYGISKRLDTALAMEALQMALRARSPKAGCIHHSDQGVQYASSQYVELLKQHAFQISMSRKGNPYDNAMAESFMKTLKQEEVYLWDYETLSDVEKRVPFFIEEVYNKKRLHSSLGYVPPAEFEEGLIRKSETLTNRQLVTI